MSKGDAWPGGRMGGGEERRQMDEEKEGKW